MRFVSLVKSVIGKTRRAASQPASVAFSDDNVSPSELARALRAVVARLNALEAVQTPEAVEFEADFGVSGATTSMTHGFGGPVRWYTVYWGSTSATVPIRGAYLVQDATSTPDTLVLRSYNAGRAVIRIEPSVNVVENP